MDSLLNKKLKRDSSETYLTPLTTNKEKYQSAKETFSRLSKIENKLEALNLLDKSDINSLFRFLRQPIILFGEKFADRLNRLDASLRSKKSGNQIIKVTTEKTVTVTEKDEFYTEGPTELKQIRLAFTAESLNRAFLRLSNEKTQRQYCPSIPQLRSVSSEVVDRLGCRCLNSSPEVENIFAGGSSGQITFLSTFLTR